MLSALLVAAALISAPAHAQTIKPHPEEDGRKSDSVDFTGRYGETMTLEKVWKIRSIMNGDTEVVDVFLPFNVDLLDTDPLNKFDPAPSFFRPENFSPYRMIRFTVQPAHGQSLAQMKEEKLARLHAAGARFRFSDKPFYPWIDAAGWPEGSFGIEVESPYKLYELTTASPSFFAVYTTGVETPPSTVMTHVQSEVQTGLAQWITAQSIKAGQEPADYHWYQPSPQAQLLFILESPGVSFLIRLLVAFALLSFIPATWAYAGRVSWAARFALLGAAATFLLGELLGLVMAPIPLNGPVHSIIFVVLLVDVALATAAYVLSRRSDLSRLRAPLLAVAVVCFLYLAANATSLS